MRRAFPLRPEHPRERPVYGEQRFVTNSSDRCAQAATADTNLDHKILFQLHREATTLAITKAMRSEPSIDWLLENQDKVVHKYFEKGLKGEI